MVEGGEDVKFIARRMVILASEDIGNANPTALVMANNTFQAVNVIGYPEARIILAQCAVYLASSPKSNASYRAIEDALQLVRETGDLPVPLPVRNAPTKLMKDIGYGKGYQYAHSYEGNFVNMEFLPDKIKGTKFYEPGNNAREEELRNTCGHYGRKSMGIEMKNIIFESSPGFMLLCIVAGVGYAWLLYTSKHPWTKNLNRLLFAFRAVTVFFLTFFLLGPIIKQVQNVLEKPVFVLLQDNSLSVKEVVDSAARMTLSSQVKELEASLQDAGYNTHVTNFSGGEGFDETFVRKQPTFTSAARRFKSV